MIRTINGIKRKVVPCRDCGKYLLASDRIEFIWEVGAVCAECAAKRESK
jgi:hypothetical protein